MPEGLPKPMAPVRGRPFLEYKIQQLRCAGFLNLILSLGYGSELIRNHFGDGSDFGVRISYALEDQPLDTAGALSHAQDLIKSEDFLVTNADTYCRLDFRALLNQHASTNAVVTMAVVFSDTGVKDFGLVELSGNGQIVKFGEKDGGQESGFVSCGVYVCSRGIFKLIPGGQRCSLETEVFPALAGKGLHAFKTSGTFIDIGTPEQWRAAQDILGEIPSGKPDTDKRA